MSAATRSTGAPPAAGRGRIWAGRIVSALPALALLMSGAMKLTHHPQLVENFVTKLGYPERSMTGIGVVELFCVALYLVPRTAVLGAVLLTGYMGGAVATHVRIGDPVLIPIALGVMIWGGLFLRDARLRALIPWRAPAQG